MKWVKAFYVDKNIIYEKRNEKEMKKYWGGKSSKWLKILNC